MCKKINVFGFFIIVFWCVIITLVYFFDLEIAKDDYELIYMMFVYYSVPFALTLFIISLLSISESLITWILGASFILIILVVTFYFSLFMVFSNMCKHSIDKVLFINKENKNIIIAKRSFGCGATDSSPASITIDKIEPFTPFFIKSTICDTITIQKEEWIRK
ncbi:MAG: hypothetical protein N4A35_15780 [Flavobacteriales bacterium]|jgi:hypothetical protein|nr:hypothetical protein [Flavobacteriales bacterium]